MEECGHIIQSDSQLTNKEVEIVCVMMLPLNKG